MCIQLTSVLYSVVITPQSNPPFSEFNRPCNEFLSVWSVFPNNTSLVHHIVQLTWVLNSAFMYKYEAWFLVIINKSLAISSIFAPYFIFTLRKWSFIQRPSQQWPNRVNRSMWSLSRYLSVFLSRGNNLISSYPLTFIKCSCSIYELAFSNHSSKASSFIFPKTTTTTFF